MPPKKTSSKSKQAIVVLGGSFCPVHAGHVAALERGRAAAERDGMTVVAGYFAVATNGHVRGKLKGRGEDLGQAFDVEGRLRMCNAVASSIDWLGVTPTQFGSAKACGVAMVAQHHAPQTSVVVVRGRDVELLTTSSGETISSTLVRREVRAGGAKAIGRLAASGVILPAVADVLQQLVAPPAAAEPPVGGAAAGGDDSAPAEHQEDAAHTQPEPVEEGNGSGGALEGNAGKGGTGRKGGKGGKGRKGGRNSK